MIRKIYHRWKRLKFALGYYLPKIKRIFSWVVKSKEGDNFNYSLEKDNMRVMAQTISVVTGCPVTEIEKYIDEPENDGELNSFLKDQIEKNNFSSYLDYPIHFGRRIGWYAIVRACKPKLVVETGVHHGLGAVLLCSALKRNEAEGCGGKYYGAELNSQFGKLLSGEYKQYGEILYGDSLTTLNNIENKIDLFINDSDHSAEHERKEYEAIKEKVSENSIILGDNAHVTNCLEEFSRKYNRKFLFFSEVVKDHWYPGGGIGISFVQK